MEIEFVVFEVKTNETSRRNDREADQSEVEVKLGDFLACEGRKTRRRKVKKRKKPFSKSSRKMQKPSKEQKQEKQMETCRCSGFNPRRIDELMR